ncbi:uncharacterized protein LOC108843990 [Raphanus sativus]|uniref:Uncharacterized protein LOC108843990 n=1 Tax=Raphanus sativus TaxID=3726 RepID=A0A6J0ML81_RAPSA|nr:uncharacterized protein LOC108843990 [Raphanus sativus]
MKRSISEGDLSPSSSKKKKKKKHHESEDLESDLAPPPIRCSISDGDFIITKEEEMDTDHDAEYPPIHVVNLESTMVNPPPPMRCDDPPPNTSPAVRVFKFNFIMNKTDPKVFLDKAWILLKPALTSILHEENLDRFYFGTINHVFETCQSKGW